MGGPLGGIIFGRRGPYGSGYPGGGGSGRPPIVLGRGNTSSAGTEEIARRSGGDSMRVDDAAALEQTLTRLRQRYALHFSVSDVNAAGERDIQLQLSDAAKRRYPGSEVRYRRTNLTSDGAASDDAVTVSRTPTNSRTASRSDDDRPSPAMRRRRAPVNEDGTRVEAESSPTSSSTDSTGGWRRAEEPARSPAPSPAPPPAEPPPARSSPAPRAEDPQPQDSGDGWRRVRPGEQP